MKTLSWIGGTILPKLESAKDMWIQRERWLGEPERIEEVTTKEKKEDKEGKDGEEGENSNTKTEVKTEKKKKIDRHLDGGVKLIREKCPFSW